MEEGQIISFYSYKGGVGRSMAVANIGCFLAQAVKAAERRVLLIDWDLEAPGLYAYFEEYRPDIDQTTGVLDYFEALKEILDRSKAAYTEIRHNRMSLDNMLPFDHYIVKDLHGPLDLMPAGRLTPAYRRSVAKFDWSSFWEQYPAAVLAFRELIESRYAYTLIDSRTGYGDMSSLCNSVMPEKLVIVFSLNKQNLDGVVDIAERSVAFRMQSDDIRPLAVFPLASRVENAELRVRDVWLRRFEDAFEKCFREIYEAKDCSLTKYFEEIFIPYSPYFSYGEKLATVVEESRAGSLRRAFEVFANRLGGDAYPWQRDEMGHQAHEPVLT